MALPTRLEISIDPRWPAGRVAEVLLSTVRDAYGDDLDIDEMNRNTQSVWADFQTHLTAEELNQINLVRHVTIPVGNLNAFIARPASREGMFIVFDAVLYVRMMEIFTAPRNLAAWAACHVRAAFDSTFTYIHWLGPALQAIRDARGSGFLPDSYSLTCARQFIIAHEYGHCLLGHLESRSRRVFRFGDHAFDAYDPAMADELQADAFARRLVARKREPLLWHQMGVDWLFGFIDAVFSMRSRLEWRQGLLPAEPTHPPLLARRMLARQEYDEMRVNSREPADREREHINNMLRLRLSVDNFNEFFPAALADAYFVYPKEIVALHDEVFQRPYSDDDLEQYGRKLAPILRAAGQELEKKHKKGRLRRLWSRVQSWF